MEFITSYLLKPEVLLGLFAAVGIVVGPGVYSKVKAIWDGSGGQDEDEDEDVYDLLALKRLSGRYDRLNCPEGKAAVKVLLAHFFHNDEA